MYKKLYRKDQGSDSGVKTSVKSEKSKKKKRQPTKVIKYGPPRVKESPWAKDLRLLAKAVGAFKSGLKDESDDEDDIKPLSVEEEKEIQETLSVHKVDMNWKQNTTAHHTDQYENDDDLIVRRGQGFQLTIMCNQPYDIEVHDMQFSFMTGRKPQPTRGTWVTLDLTEDRLPPASTENWHANILEKKGNDIVVQIHPPSTCIIGEWRLNVLTFTEKDNERTQYQYFCPAEICIIANPWCKDDDVYLEDDMMRNEYVLNDSGALYFGSQRQIGSRYWNFGQFQRRILDLSLHILRRGLGTPVDWEHGNVVKIIRAISNVINSELLLGNWSGDYDDGKKPTSWGGTPKILFRFDESNGEMVKYGQCWVFSAVGTTVCRALGIPCRSVTCFSSSHDTNESLTIDSVVDEDGNDLNEENFDSVWNFHVWNEAWMRRRDLPKGYDDWQIFDCTPQEKSEDEYQCGPAPRTAIRRGEVNVPYDCKFVFAEVNADKIDWVKKKNGEYEVLSVQKSSVGKCISTTDPYSLFRLDITHEYKYPEGSIEEREAMAKAKAFLSGRVTKERIPPKKTVEITIDTNDGIMIGQNMPVGVTVKLFECNQKRTISNLTVSAMGKTYNGKPVGDIIEILREKNVEVAPNATDVKLHREIMSEQYMGKLGEKAILKFKVVACVKETGELHVITEDLRFRQPNLALKVPENPRKDIEFELEVTVPNLPGKLTNCVLDVNGVVSDEDFFFEELEGNPVVLKVPVTVWRAGRHCITASFTCDQLDDMDDRVLFTMYE